MSESLTERHPIDELAEEFVTRYRRGEDPSITEYAERFPLLAGQIHELFPAATLLEDLKGPRSCSLETSDLPESFGDFRIVREVGRGGMGVVYEAEQLSLGRRVALKVLPGQPRLTPEQLERFRREARAAGRLHHTNIVPVFGVGEHEGLHYYVMQFIPGEGLDRLLVWLRAASPLTDPGHYQQVARLALQVAEALAYAHGQGVLHRDIKPANLLLDEDDTLWVTDFGLAKMLEQDDLTRPGEMAGTLRYSAPERFAGRSDARSDLFSLGLTIYELCVLTPAYDESDPGRLLLQATGAVFVPPRQRNRFLPRDLETILLKLLAPEPERRYATAAELADDLRRFLDDRPVLARRSSLLDRSWRWCRRNPAVAALSAALLLALGLGFAGVVWKWREAAANLQHANEANEQTRQGLDREAAERRRAEGNLDLALEAFERLAGRLALSRPGTPLDAGGDEAPLPPVVSPEAAAQLQDLLQFYERFAERNTSDPRLERDTERALRRVGTIRLRLGEYEAAEQAFRRSLELLGRMPGQDLERAQVMNDLGVTLRAAGRLPDALKSHQEALKVLEGDAGRSAVGKLESARTHSSIGALQWRLLRPLPAESSQRKALEVLAELMQEDPDNPSVRHAQARAYHDLSLSFLRRNRPEAATARQQAQEILEQLAAEFPAVPDYRAELSELLISFPPLGRIPFAKMAREMEKRYQRAIELCADLVGKYPAVPEYQALHARCRTRLGVAQQAAGRPDAVSTLRQAVQPPLAS